jgi:hypothetical protein
VYRKQVISGLNLRKHRHRGYSVRLGISGLREKNVAIGRLEERRDV